MSAEGCIQTLGSVRCGFNLGKPKNDPCYLMRHRIGFTGIDKIAAIRMQKLPPVEKFLSRLNACGEKVVNKNFCNSPTKAWIWEAYAMRIFKTFENFDAASSPFVQADAIGADGIVFIEQVKDGKIVRCRYYADKELPYEMRYHNYDTFVENQWSHKTQSWGPNGALLPWSNASYEWKSLIDEEGIGIICLFNEIYISSYNFANKTGTNFTNNWYEILYRPRDINKSDLLMIMIRNSCGRPCKESNADQFPCISTTGCSFTPNFKDVKDNDKIMLPNGKEISGKDFKAIYYETSYYEEPCIYTRSCEKKKGPDCVSSVFFGFYANGKNVYRDGVKFSDNGTNFLSLIKTYINDRPPVTWNTIFPIIPMNMDEVSNNSPVVLIKKASTLYWPTEFFSDNNIQMLSNMYWAQNTIFVNFYFSNIEVESRVGPNEELLWYYHLAAGSDGPELFINKKNQPEAKRGLMLSINLENIYKVIYKAYNISQNSPESMPEPTNEPTTPSTPAPEASASQNEPTDGVEPSPEPSIDGDDMDLSQG